MNTHIITAVLLIGERDQLAGRYIEHRIPRHDLANLLSVYRAVQAIRSEQKNIARLHLPIADFDVDEKIVAERTAEQMARGRGGRFAF